MTQTSNYPAPYPAPYPVPQGHQIQPASNNWLGIISFAMSLIGGLGNLAVIVIAGALASHHPHSYEHSSEAMFIGFGVLCGMGFCLLGLCLGIASLFQPARTRIWSILGVLFNGGALLLVVGLIVLGLAMKK